ncbi:unnamed protein product [Didymodactylos carnosus]|uniref:Uncharacterized protein n=1 Tax=Didymodactylos carnosus TaxID=1234261 RepID=A0A813ZUT0_9BILA|nr:unnamed protein product [Didymodactylos carnosus]CAF0904444.1 unnamed protein product [Didymodactylos carnosus]CAF3513110.1 unnamed protein product [Didymodactylos carnosus]CAF3686395.1 unnamed protein product [Didymodactylos carnosus]
MSAVAYASASGVSNQSITNNTALIHPYLNSPLYASSITNHHNYYPQQQPLQHQPPLPFYPTPADYSSSTSSVSSTASSIDSQRKYKKKQQQIVENKPKTSMKRKSTGTLDDEEDDDLLDNNCCLDIPTLSRRSTAITGGMSGGTSSGGGGGGEEDKEKQARENHCEIERRRRVKMATYFAELCDMVPSCSNLARKPDKLTILRMAAQFMKSLRTNSPSTIQSLHPQHHLNNGQQHDLHKPSFLNDQELKYLMIESCDAFLFALHCDNARIIYVSDAIQYILSYTCQEWYTRLFYDFIHPDDIEKVREQLNLQQQNDTTNGNSSGGGRVLDLKTGTVKKDIHSTGARLVSCKRSFICRLRLGGSNSVDPHQASYVINPCILRRRHRPSLGPSQDGHLYEVVHVSGYIRNLNGESNSTSLSSSTSTGNSGFPAFVAIARIQNSCSPNINDLNSTSNCNLHTEFTCRCNRETAEILFIDQRCQQIIGYKPHELLHKCIFELIHLDDRSKIQDLFKRAIALKNVPTPTSAATSTISCRVQLSPVVNTADPSNSDYIVLKCSTYAFCNPCTDEIEFVIFTFTSNKPLLSLPSTTTTSAIATSVIANPLNILSNGSSSEPQTPYSTTNYDSYSSTRTGRGAIVVNPTRWTTTATPSSDGYNDVTYNNRTYASNNGGGMWADTTSWTNTTPSDTTELDMMRTHYETQTNVGTNNVVVTSNTSDYDVNALPMMYQPYEQV